MSPHGSRQKERLRLGAILLAGFFYFGFCVLTGRSIPCPFHELTGWYCPGCGTTRMMLALARLDVARAFRLNPVAMIALPLLGFHFAKRAWAGPSPDLRGMRWVWLALALAFAALGLFRNLPIGRAWAPV